MELQGTTKHTLPTWLLPAAILVAVLAAAVSLWFAFDLPFVHGHLKVRLPDWVPNFAGIHQKIRRYIVQEGQLQVGPQYLLAVIRRLLQGRDPWIGVAVLVFSAIIPVLKIVLVAVAAFATRLSLRWRMRLGATVALVSKWSMADVFIVALVIVLYKAEGLSYTISAGKGVYMYAASAACSSLGGWLALRHCRNLALCLDHQTDTGVVGQGPAQFLDKD